VGQKKRQHEDEKYLAAAGYASLLMRTVSLI
jgi:hypothetical protein